MKAEHSTQRRKGAKEAKELTRFTHSCTCGGFAHQINGRDPANPHMSWCPQREEYAEWWKALHENPRGAYDQPNT